MTSIFRLQALTPGPLPCKTRPRAQPASGTRIQSRPRGRRAGATLAELMVGMTVAGTACLAALSGLLMSLRTANANLVALTAASAARSVGEQILAIDYLTLFSNTLPVDVPSNPGGTLEVGVWNERTDDFRHTPNNPIDDLRLRINPSTTRVIEPGGLDYAQVVIQYEWTDTSFFGPRTRSDQFTMLVAPISSF